MYLDNFTKEPKDYIRMAIKLGVTIADAKGHDWRNAELGRATIEYLTSYSGDVATAMQNVRGINSAFQIKAMTLGLTRAETDGHNWPSVYNGDNIILGLYSIDYLKENLSIIHEAMDTIRGITSIAQLNAIEMGLTRAETDGHNWNDAAQTLTYLAGTPNFLCISDSMDNIKGLDELEISNILARHSLGSMYLTPLQMYIERFTADQLSALQNGATFQEAMPSAYKKIELLNSYMRGAVSAALNPSSAPDDASDKGLLRQYVPENVSGCVSSYLTSFDVSRLLLSSHSIMREAENSLKEFCEIESRVNNRNKESDVTEIEDIHPGL